MNEQNISPDLPLGALVDYLRRLDSVRDNLLAQIEKVDSDRKIIQRAVEAMNRVDPIFRAIEAKQLVPPAILEPASRERRTVPNKGSIPYHVVRILRHAGQPMKAADLTEAIRRRGKKTNRDQVSSSLRREANSGRWFRACAPGVFGLIEWPENPPPEPKPSPQTGLDGL